MQPGASGLLSIQAELRQRTANRERSQHDIPKTTSQEYQVRAVKGKKLSTDFILPKEGVNTYQVSSSSSSSSSNKRAKLLDIDKYKTHGRGPNVSLLSSNAKTPSAKLEQERLRALRAKAKAYEAMTQASAEDEDNDITGGLIDFKRKAAENALDPSSSSNQRDPPPKPFFDDEEEDQVTYIDEFGRTRTAPRSQVPKDRLPENLPYGDPNSSITYGKQKSFPIYRPPSPKLRVSRAVRKQIASGAPPLSHFDPKAEVRNRGAGLFQFSKDEADRAKQMEALQLERQRTERERRARFGMADGGREAVEGFASAEERPWGREDDDHEEGALGPEEDEDVPSAPLDPFAAVEMMAASAKSSTGGPSSSSSSNNKGKKRKHAGH
ncbi:hypothetical protein CF326_g6482 [Tilletia indica]|nr:hypothetical protein CF326_g6482 [Tilletia indica]